MEDAQESMAKTSKRAQIRKSKKTKAKGVGHCMNTRSRNRQDNECGQSDRTSHDCFETQKAKSQQPASRKECSISVPRSVEQLCKICQPIFSFDQFNDQSFKIENGYQMNDLVVSAKSGCDLCSLVLSILDHDLEISPKVQLTGEVEWSWKSHDVIGTQGSICWRLNGSSLPLDQLKVQVNGWGSGKTKVVQDSTSSEATFDLIKEWIKECKSHAKCRDWLKICGMKNKLPKRVIDVGLYGKRLHTHLVNTEDLPKSKAPYIALSYRWGGPLRMKLLTTNIHDFLSELPWGLLPRTFQDAIVATRRLGVKYLWIDALCILQDSDEDWRQQAPLMGEIYAGSYLNISASSSSNSEGSLFQDRYAKASNVVQVVVDNYTWACYAERLHSTHAWNEINSAIVNTRGWVLQERLMSPRTVFFSRDQVAWECMRTTSLEFCYDSYAAIFDFGREPWHIKNLLDSDPLSHYYKNPIGPVLRNNNLRCAWRQIVYQYTGCTLTFHSDRLFAILGIAKVFEKHLGLPPNDYHYGLWRSYLAEELMWTAKVDQIARCSHVPSWSWLSASGPVELPDPEVTETIIQVLESSSLSDEVMDQTSKDWGIRIKGPLCKVSSLRVSYNPNFKKWTGSVDLSENDRYVHVASLHIDHKSEYLRTQLEKNPCYLLLGSIISITNPYRIEAEKQGYAHYGRGYRFLIIQPDKTKRGQYRRVGILILGDSNESKGDHQLFDRYLRSDNIPESMYEEKDSDLNYTIILT